MMIFNYNPLLHLKYKISWRKSKRTYNNNLYKLVEPNLNFSENCDTRWRAPISSSLRNKIKNSHSIFYRLCPDRKFIFRGRNYVNGNDAGSLG